jgi:hypothetical protein
MNEPCLKGLKKRWARRQLLFPALFWSRVEIGSEDQCWNWTGGKTQKGYGVCENIKRGVRSAHRAAWTLIYGPIKKGLSVLHHCDNPPCCNPLHLFVGTNNDNIQDMVSKGRHGMFQANPESHPRAKLTWPKVKEIRRLYAAGAAGYENLGKRYGVSQATTWAIVKHKTWRVHTLYQSLPVRLTK